MSWVTATTSTVTTDRTGANNILDRSGAGTDFTVLSAGDQLRIPSGSTVNYFVVQSVTNASQLVIVGTWSVTLTAQSWAYLDDPDANLILRLNQLPTEVLMGATPDTAIKLAHLPVEALMAATPNAVITLHHLPVEVLMSIPQVIPYHFVVQAIDADGCVGERGYDVNVIVPNDPYR